MESYVRDRAPFTKESFEGGNVIVNDLTWLNMVIVE